MSERVFTFGRTRLVVRVDHPVLARAVRELLGPGAARRSAPVSGRLSLVSAARRADVDIRPAPDATLVSARGAGAWRLEVYRQGDGCVVDCGALGAISIRAGEGCGDAQVVAPETAPVVQLASAVRVALTELLKTRGLFPLHAAAVARGRRVVLIPAPRARGKSTTALALARSGYRFIADDLVLLSVAAASTEVIALPGNPRITPWALERLPHLEAGARPAPGGKLEIGSVAQDSRPGDDPAVLLFPWITDSRESGVEPLSRVRALETLLPESVSAFIESVSRAHFRALSDLARTRPAYRLYLGTDLDALGDLVDSVLERVAHSCPVA